MQHKKYCLVRNYGEYKIINLDFEKYMDFFEEESPFDGSKTLYGWNQYVSTYDEIYNEEVELGEPIKYSNSERVLEKLKRKLESD